ncbi:Ribonuclease T2 domain containing protein [Asbolus verrucosus]|uniref:Ribonuclease T2 domain containing protein n=1 Tax=Asbolus verrucosus TaxID=1661398 RepID=A0A482V9K1_ASBVE|nr:Ribonuclease T2 domain containing protein [Asbolus verrucosus]
MNNKTKFDLRSNCDDDFSKSKPTPTPFHDWDYIVYSQRWPVTGCSQWKERSPSNTCNMPENNSTWTVHGVWPTKIGTNGPYFCNSAIHFDPDQLEPMMKELLEFWPNIEANTKPNSFWKHEWNKHGTCASTLPQLNSVTNFFKQGLQWNQDYNLATILTKNEIVPNQQGYNISDIYNAIKTTINKNPTVECVVDGKSKQSLISEIHICFNKSLDLIDCNITKQQEGDILSNCNGKDNVMYFATIPNNTLFTRSKNHADFGGSVDATVEECLQNDFYEKNLLKLYSLVKFLIWFTL